MEQAAVVALPILLIHTYKLNKLTKQVNQYGSRRSDSEVFVENSTYARHLIKKRVLKQNLIEEICAMCSLPPVWQGKPMVLILDHINGVNNDHRLENLRFVCSNCDSQLPTYKSRNRKSKDSG